MTYTELVNLMIQAAALEEKGPIPDFGLMASIALKESGGTTFAHHHNHDGSTDRGIWQINSCHQSEFPDLGDFQHACYTPISNARMAIRIWRAQGYKAWSSYNALS